MQSTILMLMTLTGLGCHHKACDYSYAAPACYSETVSYSGCYASAQSVGYTDYAPACYATAYSACYNQTYSSCYGATWDACYSSASCYGDYGGCYGGGHHKRGLFSGLFSCFKGRKHSGYSACYGSWNEGCYSTPVFGSYTPTYGGDVVYGAPVTGSGQWSSSQGTWSTPVNSGVTITPAQTGDAVPPPSTATPSNEVSPPANDVPNAPEPGTIPGTGSIPEVPAPGAGDIPSAPGGAPRS
jgi:hypothetical protein